MPAVSGFSQQLELRVGARPKQPWVIMECSASLHVLAEGARKNPELLLSRQFEECVRELRAAYDFIVIDGPPLSETAACRAVNDVVDGVVLLHGITPGEELARVHSMFPSRRLSLVPAAGS
jgi:Mrp family chromosome partitioning ATPase